MRRSLGAAALVSALLAVLVGEGGCEIAIGDTVPSFLCNGGASPCPQGQVCDTTHHCVVSCTTPGFAGCPSGTTCNALSGLCLPIGDGGMMDEVSVNDGPGPDVVDEDSMTTEAEASPVDTGGDTNNPCATGSAIALCPCSGNSACASKLCVDALSVGTGLYQAAGSTSFCSQACCTSNECPANTVCYATGQGGNYCVNPMWIGRTSGAGTGQGGASCSLGPRDCRSGLCSSSHCVDTCCSTEQASSECAGGDTCSFGNFPGAVAIDKNYGASCGPSGGAPGGTSCSFDSECASGLCAAAPNESSNRCKDACRNSSDCNSNGYHCNYVIPPNPPTPTPVVAACFTPQGSLTMGQTCDPMNDQCEGFCDPSTTKCTDVCFADSDCSGMTGWHCRDSTISVQGGGSYSILCCGP